MPVSRRRSEIQEMGEEEYQRAEYALNVRRYDLAIEIMQRILSVHPENSVAFHTIARAYTHKKMTDRAIEAIRESLRLDPTNSFAHSLYGALLKEKGDYGRAEYELLMAIRTDPSNHLAHYIYADFLLEQKKNIPLSRWHCLKALELYPDDEKYHWMMGRIFAAEGNLDQAETAYRNALRLEPEDTRTHNSYGALLFNQRHDPRAAFEHFRIAVIRLCLELRGEHCYSLLHFILPYQAFNIATLLGRRHEVILLEALRHIIHKLAFIRTHTGMFESNAVKEDFEFLHLLP